MFSGFCASKTVPFHPNEVRKPSTVGYSTVSEALTQTGPDHHEGNSGVSVKPPLPVSPAAQPRAFKGIFGYFCFQDKSDSPISLRSKRGETVFRDRKSTRLNSSHVAISYAVFCLKKKKTQ